MTTYKAVTRIKSGEGVWERGDTVSAKDVGGQENFDVLVESESVVDEKRFNALFPEFEAPELQPSNTPSNLAQVEGTKLEAKAPTEDKK